MKNQKREKEGGREKRKQMQEGVLPTHHNFSRKRRLDNWSHGISPESTWNHNNLDQSVVERKEGEK